MIPTWLLALLIMAAFFILPMLAWWLWNKFSGDPL